MSTTDHTRPLFGTAHRGELANKLKGIFDAQADKITDPWSEVAHAVWVEHSATVSDARDNGRTWMLACDVDGCSTMYAGHEDLRGYGNVGTEIARKRAEKDGWSYTNTDGDRCPLHDRGAEVLSDAATAYEASGLPLRPSWHVTTAANWMRHRAAALKIGGDR